MTAHDALNYVFPHVPPERMTPRARHYLVATSLYCLCLAAGMALQPDRFGTASFNVVKQTMFGGLVGWSIVHFIVGVLALVAAWRGHEVIAYAALICAALVVGPWAVGFFMAYLTIPRTSPSGAIAYTFICVIHLIQARQPMRSPFDPVLRALNVRRIKADAE